MEKGRGKGTDTLQTDNVFTRKEYIEREAAIEEVCRGCGFEFSDEPCEPCDCEIMARLNAIPAADVVPVVLCKHCRWAVFTPYGKAYGCRLLSTKPNYLLGITEDFFCAYGERMDMVTDCNQVKDGDANDG